MRRLLLKLRRRRRLARRARGGARLPPRAGRGARQPGRPRQHRPITEEALDLWRFRGIENLWRDVVYGARGLARSPALVVSAMLSLGLGIGVNTAMFSLAAELLLGRPSLS